MNASKTRMSKSRVTLTESSKNDSERIAGAGPFNLSHRVMPVVLLVSAASLSQCCPQPKAGDGHAAVASAT